MSQGIIWMRWIIEICVWKDLMWMRGKGDWWQGWREAACQPRRGSHVKRFWLTSLHQPRFGPVLSTLWRVTQPQPQSRSSSDARLRSGHAHSLVSIYFVLDLGFLKSFHFPFVSHSSYLTWYSLCLFLMRAWKLGQNIRNFFTWPYPWWWIISCLIFFFLI